MATKTKPTPVAFAPAAEIREPTQTQALMLDAPWGDDLCIVSACGTGMSWGIALLLARDAAHFKTNFAALVTRQTYQGLTELQGLLWRYFSQAFPGNTYSGSDLTFRLGGKEMPFGRVELAYVGSGPGEQVRALARLQGRSFVLALHDEVGAYFDSSFIDTAAATLRGPAGIPTRTGLLGKPGGLVVGYPHETTSRSNLQRSATEAVDQTHLACLCTKSLMPSAPEAGRFAFRSAGWQQLVRVSLDTRFAKA